MQNYNNATIGYYENAKDNQWQSVSLVSIFNRIRSGSGGLAEKTQQAEKLANGDDDQAYRDFKSQNLTVFTPAGTFSPIRRNANLVQHTGLVVLDYDHNRMEANWQELTILQLDRGIVHDK